ncbi:MAG: dienelactone hydrolase family protein [Bacteroidota bacterium]
MRYIIVSMFLLILFSACAPSDSEEPTAVAMQPTPPMHGEMVTYGVGEDVDIELRGYLSEPVNPDSVLEAMGRSADQSLPGLIIIHEWWGLNEDIELMASRFAGEGFRTLAVDLYNGQVATTPELAQEAMETATENMAGIDANIRAAYDYLTEQHGADEVAILGWCFGGTMALRSAVMLEDDIDAAVIYYGRLDDVDEEQLEAIEAPVLGFFGSEDERIPVDQVREFERTMNDLGKDVEIEVFEGAEHAFANPAGPNFVESAARAS